MAAHATRRYARRIGLLAVTLAAATAAAAPTTTGLGPGVTRSVSTTPGGARVNVLTVDRTRARLQVVTARDRVPGRETPTAMVRRAGALAAVNGGFFAVADGDPTGVVVRDGTVLSEPVGARTALVVPADPAAPAAIRSLRWAGVLRADGARRLVDGVNRVRGRIPACGGVGGDQPTQRIDPATVCTDPSELVVLTPEYAGQVSESGTTVAVAGGRVVSVGRGPAVIPDDGYVLTGSGDAAAFLRDHLSPGDAPDLDLGFRDGTDPTTAAVILGGAPRLLRDGRVRVTAAREGRGGDKTRVPRTLAGVRADGAVLLITIDRAGATLQEAARLARAAGAVDAVGLDSGGSTAMVVDGRLVTRPADGAERPVANALVVG